MVLFVYICKQEVIAKVKRKNQKKSLINVLTAAVLCVCMCVLCLGCGGNAGQGTGAASLNEEETVEGAADASTAAANSDQQEAED